MNKIQNLFFLRKTALLTFAAAFISFTANLGFSQTIPSQKSKSNASALIEKYHSLTQQLLQNQYRRPLFIESTQSATNISSTVYAVLDSPFPTVNTVFTKPDLWCEVLILHLNTKYCQANPGPATVSKLEVNIGKKTPQSLAETFKIDFSYQVIESSPNYLAVQLFAEKGPLSTTDYQLSLQTVPLPEGKTFINLRYSYNYGMASRLAMQVYLSTLGHEKVGFTKISPNDKTQYIGGMRGAVERNTMRYYLAIEAYLASLNQTPDHQFNSRLQYWFDATEEYPQQLHEIDRLSYLAMKKDEYHRQKNFHTNAQ